MCGEIIRELNSRCGDFHFHTDDHHILSHKMVLGIKGIPTSASMRQPSSQIQWLQVTMSDCNCQSQGSF